MNEHWENVIHAALFTIVCLFAMHSCTSCAEKDLAKAYINTEASK